MFLNFNNNIKTCRISVLHYKSTTCTKLNKA